MVDNFSHKAKIFMSAIWLYSWVIFCLTKIFNYCLYLALSYVPDQFIIYNFMKKRDNICILLAKDGRGKTITNKLKLFMDLKSVDKNGEITFSINEFGQFIKTTFIWLAYIFKIEGENYKYLINSLDKNTFQVKDMEKAVNFLIVEIGEKMLLKFKNGELLSEAVTKEDILFGDIKL